MEAQLRIHKRNTPWVGQSQALTQTRRTLNALAQSQLPVLIQGQTGTGKRIAAKELHELGKGKHSPFVTVCCKRWNTKDLIKLMDESWEYAQGGTLFVRNIEAIKANDAAQIKDFWLRANQQDDVRLIASTCHVGSIDGNTVNIDSHFLSWLQYHCLTITLPTLSERSDDIPALIRYYQQQDSAMDTLTFTPCAAKVLSQYHWPDNIKQLKRCLDKLVVLASTKQIDKHSLLQHFPSMLQPDNVTKPISLSMLQIDNMTDRNRIAGDNILRLALPHQATTKMTKLPPKSLSTTLNKEAICGHHPALDRAIPYLFNNYRKRLNMEDLASHACVSPSHLSFLFKRYVGQSFKQTLLNLRINEAMKLLVDNPERQVTHVCDDVGFSDLSFFVRKFKATVGLSPGVYRDQHRASNNNGYKF
ncbi:helix-turn-helix domain-containing protein [Shewanella sp. Scap07]|uniref:helix-turn-helix domain-containing protein n=1 Tax=Shewanella sp. Scap07 TaxID=2589987 RepID=UPI0015BD3E62|nr:helix-turn-helix domain-containing protein [Shewanella sp. Scap07]QLE83675.1 helix-turn-helix domain-containing protein [Shewanella sp. Scap07]